MKYKHVCDNCDCKIDIIDVYHRIHKQLLIGTLCQTCRDDDALIQSWENDIEYDASMDEKDQPLTMRDFI